MVNSQGFFFLSSYFFPCQAGKNSGTLHVCRIVGTEHNQEAGAMRNMMQRMGGSRRPLSPWAVLFWGLGAMAIGIFMHTTQQSFLETAQETTGIVQEVTRTFETRYSDGVSRQEEVYYSVVAFTVDGNSYTFRERGRNREGSEVAVLYDPENPERAEIKSSMGQIVWPLLAGGGLVGFIAGIVMVIKRKKAA